MNAESSDANNDAMPIVAPREMTGEQLERHLAELEVEKRQAEILKFNREARWYRPANAIAFFTAFAAIIGLWVQYRFSEVRHQRELLEIIAQREEAKADLHDIQRNMQDYVTAISRDLGVTIKSGREVAIGETTTVSGTVTDTSNDEPLVGVHLVAVETANDRRLGEAVTDEKGNYVLEFKNSGPFTLLISKQDALIAGPTRIPGLAGETDYTVDIRLTNLSAFMTAKVTVGSPRTGQDPQPIEKLEVKSTGQLQSSKDD